MSVALGTHLAKFPLLTLISCGERLSRKACVHQLIIDHVELLLSNGREVAGQDLAGRAVEDVSAFVSTASSARVHIAPINGLKWGL